MQYLSHEVFLAPGGVVEPLHQQSMELLQDQRGPFHLPGAPSCVAVRVVSTVHTIVICSQQESTQLVQC